MRALAALFLVFALAGCVTATATHDRVTAAVVGAGRVSACAEVAAPPPGVEPKRPRPCLDVEGPPLDEHASDAMRSLFGVLVEAIKLVIPFI